MQRLVVHLPANLFRATQTESKLRREHIQGKAQTNQVHYDVRKTVRQTIRELGEIIPKDLHTPDKSINELKNRYVDLF